MNLFGVQPISPAIVELDKAVQSFGTYLQKNEWTDQETELAGKIGSVVLDTIHKMQNDKALRHLTLDLGYLAGSLTMTQHPKVEPTAAVKNQIAFNLMKSRMETIAAKQDKVDQAKANEKTQLFNVGKELKDSVEQNNDYGTMTSEDTHAEEMEIKQLNIRAEDE